MICVPAVVDLVGVVPRAGDVVTCGAVTRDAAAWVGGVQPGMYTHWETDVDPMGEAYPSGQNVHVSLPVVDLYVPFTHCVHCPKSPVYPWGQGEPVHIF